MLEERREIALLNPTRSVALRTAVVLAFLLGMPLVAVPQIAERLQGLLPAKPQERAAASHTGTSQPYRAAAENTAASHGTTVTTLAAERSPPQIQPAAEPLHETIEALKAEFVAAGVTYMVLERVETGAGQYRFRFDQPVAAGSAYRKRFQVVDDTPDQAMRRGLAELQQWRVAGREPAHLERPTVILR